MINFLSVQDEKLKTISNQRFNGWTIDRRSEPCLNYEFFITIAFHLDWLDFVMIANFTNDEKDDILDSIVWETIKFINKSIEGILKSLVETSERKIITNTELVDLVNDFIYIHGKQKFKSLNLTATLSTQHFEDTERSDREPILGSVN